MYKNKMRSALTLAASQCFLAASAFAQVAPVSLPSAPGYVDTATPGESTSRSQNETYAHSQINEKDFQSELGAWSIHEFRFHSNGQTATSGGAEVKFNFGFAPKNDSNGDRLTRAHILALADIGTTTMFPSKNQTQFAGSAEVDGIVNISPIGNGVLELVGGYQIINANALYEEAGKIKAGLEYALPSGLIGATLSPGGTKVSDRTYNEETTEGLSGEIHGAKIFKKSQIKLEVSAGFANLRAREVSVYQKNQDQQVLSDHTYGGESWEKSKVLDETADSVTTEYLYFQNASFRRLVVKTTTLPSDTGIMLEPGEILKFRVGVSRDVGHLTFKAALRLDQMNYGFTQTGDNGSTEGHDGTRAIGLEGGIYFHF